MAISDAQRLALYNGALRIIRETKLAAIDEEREPRRILDDAWTGLGTGGAIKACLEMGIWHFAKRTVRITYNPSITPSFGYRYAYDKPEDYVRLVEMCSDEHFNTPITAYRENGPYWFSDVEPLYVSYVSIDDAWGLDPTLWPESFRFVVEAYLAKEVALGLTVSDSIRDRAEAQLESMLSKAKGLGAMGQPTRFAPASSWETARGGHGQRDGGNRGRLIG